MKAATPGGTARAEDPGLNEVREAAEAVPPESVRRNGKQPLFVLSDSLIKYNYFAGMMINSFGYLVNTSTPSFVTTTSSSIRTPVMLGS